MSVWNHKDLKKNVDFKEFLTLDEAFTPIDKFKFEDIELIIKREDKNPTGSWKDRASAFKISQLKNGNILEAVISSSGNAAISLIEYANKLYPELKLNIVVSESVNPKKLEILQEKIKNTKHEIIQTKETRKKSIEISATKKIPNLRSSLDDYLLKAYWSLGFEIESLLNQNDSNNNTAVVMPVSSGTAFVGIAQGLFYKLEQEFLMPKLYTCQTQNIHPIVDIIENTNLVNTEKSFADSIIDSIALRSPQVLKTIKQTNATAFAITNEELVNAQEFMNSKNINDLSFTSLLSIAGFLKLKEENKEIKKFICIASGR